MTSLLCFVLFVGTLIFEKSSGSEIVFNGSPQAIKAGLTASLHLRCSLNDTSASSSLIGKRHDDTSSLQKRDDVTHTSGNVEDVTSIIVMKDGRDVASVTHGHQAKVMMTSSNLQVTGGLGSAAGERGHLELTWRYPTATDAGQYVCEVATVTNTGHTITFRQVLEIGISEPTMADLVEHIHDLHIENENMKTENQNVKTENQALKTQMSTIQTQVAEVQHIESGILQCGRSDSWTGRKAYSPPHRYTDVSHTFTSPYSKPPHLQYSVTDLYYSESRSGDRKYTIYWVDQVSVTGQGFTLRCEIEDLTTFYAGITIRWSSFPQH